MVEIPNEGEEFGGYHPLFLPEDGATPQDFAPEPIKVIQVYRLENGQQIKIPETFNGDDPGFRTDQDLFNRYGGGTYLLVARGFQGQIYAKRRYHFAGPPRGAAAAPPNAPAAPQAGVTMPHGGMSELAAILTLFVNMMQQGAQQQQAMMAAMMQSQAASQAQTTQVLIAALSGAQQASAGGAGAMSTLVGKLIERAPANSPTEMISAVKGFMDLAKQAQESGAGGEAAQWAQLAGLAGSFFEGIRAAKQMQQTPTAQQPAPQDPNVVTVQPQPGPGTNGAPVPG